MLELLMITQFLYSNQLDIPIQKSVNAAFIQSGISNRIDQRKQFYKDEINFKINLYRKMYLNENIEKNLGKVAFISNLLINKKVGISYEF